MLTARDLCELEHFETDVGRQTRDVWNGGPSLMREGNGSTPSPAHILCVKPNNLHIKWKTKSLIENQKT